MVTFRVPDCTTPSTVTSSMVSTPPRPSPNNIALAIFVVINALRYAACSVTITGAMRNRHLRVLPPAEPRPAVVSAAAPA